MSRRVLSYLAGLLLPALTATLLAAAPAAATGACSVHTRPIAIPVDGEQATGLVYEPRGCVVGNALVVAAHGHKGSAAQYSEYLISIAARTATPVLSMDLRGSPQWPTGDWNLWAGWRDLVAATQWYKGVNPGVARTVLWGWSQGAMTSGLAAAYGPAGLFDYWVDTFGPSDLFTHFQGPAADYPALQAQIQRDAGGCVPAVCPLAYAERSPALQAGRMNIRHAFLVHGTADEVVPYAASMQMRAALMLAGKPSTMYSIVSGRTLNGVVEPGRHNVGPALFEAGCVVERLLLGTEPLDGNRDFLIDVAAGVVAAPPAPPNAKCAA
ncbi:alpha/beta hydrolase family protein [Nocardia carnea]|uniref:alpha/beta hydrolase family protein n=1 Tax=Nocardia carnea TaxID=37328 RepID=UPI002458652E|nr:prolyl oligopeptidase family serine peptidase [Nocardia carnea]